MSTLEEIKAEVYKINDEGKETLVFFKITDDVEKLIDYRKISLNVIWWSYTGLVLPKDAVVYENGSAYVVRKRNGNNEKIMVKIIKDNNNYCIIDNYDSEELVELGYTTEEIEQIKTIKVYDEIVINPEIQ